MQAAFHFNADELKGYYGFLADEALLRRLAAEPPTQIDARVMHGDVRPSPAWMIQPYRHVVASMLYFYVDPTFGSPIADSEPAIDASLCEVTG